MTLASLITTPYLGGGFIWKTYPSVPKFLLSVFCVDNAQIVFVPFLPSNMLDIDIPSIKSHLHFIISITKQLQ